MTERLRVVVYVVVCLLAVPASASAQNPYNLSAPVGNLATIWLRQSIYRERFKRELLVDPHLSVRS